MTNVLAIETSHPVGSVVLRRTDGTLVSAMLSERGGQARALAPAIRDLLARAGLAPRDLGLIVVDVGPGGYTGLRLGLATAKTFAVVLRIPVVGVTSTAVLAALPEVPAGAILATIESTQQSIYGQAFEKHADGSLTAAGELFIEPAAAALARCQTPGLQVIGSGARSLRVQGAQVLAGAEELIPSAEVALNLGWSRFLRGDADDERRLLPLYLRPSEAERLWAQRHGTGNH